MNRNAKSAIIERIKSRLEGSSIAIVSDFKGMPVEEMTQFRVKIRATGGEFVVVKNTLARIAFTGSRHDAIKDMFRENCGLVIGRGDPIVLAKAVTDFARTSKNLTIKHADLEGQVLNAGQLEELARLPGRQELLAMTLGTMNAVPTNFVSLFGNIIRGLLYALKALEEKKAA
ncbi:MAG: 50S ribosomal protein L10 [Deltaproteobacteria bacterium]|nr:50S ribosomal protein L10 [Deltaproteobacteria bacterium]